MSQNAIFRELPQWVDLRGGGSSGGGGASGGGTDQRNARETSILKSKMGTYVIQSHEILNDHSQLRSLGLLQESMVRVK